MAGSRDRGKRACIAKAKKWVSICERFGRILQAVEEWSRPFKKMARKARCYLTMAKRFLCAMPNSLDWQACGNSTYRPNPRKLQKNFGHLWSQQLHAIRCGRLEWTLLCARWEVASGRLMVCHLQIRTSHMPPPP